MKEAATTWALVAGIDVYDEPAVPRLGGAVADAVAAVTWLRGLGVPDGQILLHAAPSDASRPALEALGLPWQPAYERDLWKSVARLLKVTDGTRLFVFLSGHGLYELATGRLFLTQEAGVDGVWNNLGIEKYIELFRSMVFPRQFLVLDGCQNYPYPETARPTIEATMYGGKTGFTGKAGNFLAACFAAGQGERALEIDGRGLFLRHLLAGLDFDEPCRQAIDLDFETGARTLDLRQLFYKSVQEAVEREAWAQTPPIRQRPDFIPYGPSQASYPVVRLRDVDTAALEVRVKPAAAVDEVRRVQVMIYEPLRERQVPRLEGEPLALPLVSHLPKGMMGSVFCALRQGSWSLDRPRQEFMAADDVTLTFELRGAPEEEVERGLGSTDGRWASETYAVEPEESAEEVVRVRTHDTAGATIANTFDYEKVAKGFALPGDFGVDVTMQHHEIGPDFVLRGHRRQSGRRLAKRWAEAIQRMTPPEVVVSLEVPAGAAESPTLRLELPAGGAASMAGFLTGRSLVWVGSPGDEPVEPLWREPKADDPRRTSLGHLERHPERPVEPGPVRVRLDLPWGSWTSLIRVPESGEVMVALPASVGTPPLRVALRDEAGRREGLILGTEGEAPAIHLRRGLFGPPGLPFASVPAGSAAWALQPPESSNVEQELAEVELEDGRRALFPLMKRRALALDLTRGGLRVEALSAVETPAWDLLVAAGRLDSLHAREAEDLAHGKWEDWLLGLAGAYAVYARPADHEPGYLEVILGNLARLAADAEAPDLDLLRIAFLASGRRGLPPEMARALLPWAEKGSVPLLRWGVGLAVRLLQRVRRPRKALADWRDALAALEPRLSPISVWTAWTEE